MTSGSIDNIAQKGCPSVGQPFLYRKACDRRGVWQSLQRLEHAFARKESKANLTSSAGRMIPSYAHVSCIALIHIMRMELAGQY